MWGLWYAVWTRRCRMDNVMDILDELIAADIKIARELGEYSREEIEEMRGEDLLLLEPAREANERVHKLSIIKELIEQALTDIEDPGQVHILLTGKVIDR